MPNITLYHSGNLQGAGGASVLAAVNAAAAASGLFEEADIKSRTVPATDFRIGTEAASRGFVHVTVGMGPRTEPEHQRLSRMLADALERCIAAPPGMSVQICVEIQPVHMTAYVKRTVGP